MRAPVTILPSVSLVAITLFSAAAAFAADPAPAPSVAAPAPARPEAKAAPAAPARPVVAAAGPGATPGPSAAGGPTAAARAPQTPAPGAAPPRPATAAPRTVAVAPTTGAVREPAPRPVTDVRVQSRFATKAKNTQLFAAAEYLSRGDYYNSPGARVGGTYYPLESLGLELQMSHYWSSLNDTAERVKRELGALPDSHAPAWLFLAGARYSIGYGKLMVGGLGGAIHFEPQAFAHAGLHAYEGDAGPSGDFGLGLLVFLTPKMFTRIDAAIVFEREDRSNKTVNVWGTLPSIAVGGTL